jgi:malate dehydrogenase (oxaloacetate-decarboxylating)(NADP+)
MDIPVFHDDQHGTAIIAAAGLINALDLTGRDIKTTKLVCNGAGAAGDRLHGADQGDGLQARQRHPVRHQGRDLPGPHRGHEPVEIGACGQDRPRTLAEAMEGADVVLRPLAEGRAFRPR